MDWSIIMNTLNVLNESQLWSVIIACIMMLAHKVLMLILIAVSYVLTIGFTHIANVSFTVPSVEVVCVYIIVMEMASILENVTKAYPEFANTSLFKYLNTAQKGV